MEGESGPKARPRGVVDGKQVNIPVLVIVSAARDEGIRGVKKNTPSFLFNHLGG